MNQWIMMPLLIPAVAAALIVITARFDQVLARVFCLCATLLMLAVDLVLLSAAGQGNVLYYALGNWPEPYAVSLTVDRLTALMLTLAGIIGVVISLASFDGQDTRSRHFHALLLFQLMGVNGAFLTHDLFNLFVYFEVMLGASYGLMVYAGGKRRLQSGIQFITINLVGSSLFLIAVGLIYSVTGMLDLDALREQWSKISPNDLAIANTGLVLLFVVFIIKAAVVPFHFWMPSAYANTEPIVAGLFALSTKVGIYSIVRVYYTVIAGQEVMPTHWVSSWILPASLLTVILGMIGVLGSRTLGQMASYAALASSGSIMTAVSLFTPTALVAGLFYLIHSTVTGALTFLVVAAVIQQRPKLLDRLRVGEPFPRSGLIGALFLVGAIGLIGLPPLSGFIGKLFIIQSVDPGWPAIVIAGVLLGSSLLGMMGFARAGSTLFWKPATHMPRIAQPPAATSIMTLVAAGLLTVGVVGLSLSAGSVVHFLEQLVFQLNVREFTRP